MALPTPIYNLNEFPNVYEPSEDTHLFLDALEMDRDYIVEKQPVLACEIGSGSGVLITALATILECSCAYFSTDINISACNATKKTSILNNVTVEPIRMDLTTMLRCQFDIILFNPPYVVTGSEEVRGSGLDRAYAGGRDGREITDKFLSSLPTALSKNGVCYLLLLRENRVKDIVNYLKNEGLGSELVLEKKIPGEYLYVYKFYWL